jgi:hypothetical protein
MHSQEKRAKIALHNLLHCLFLLPLKTFLDLLVCGREKGAPGALSSQSSLWCQARRRKGKDIGGEGNEKEKSDMVSAFN